MSLAGFIILVPTARLELAQLSPLPPQDSVSTNFTTSAQRLLFYSALVTLFNDRLLLKHRASIISVYRSTGHQRMVPLQEVPRCFARIRSQQEHLKECRMQEPRHRLPGDFPLHRHLHPWTCCRKKLAPGLRRKKSPRRSRSISKESLKIRSHRTSCQMRPNRKRLPYRHLCHAASAPAR
jgi:hypothetical protein